MELDLIDSPIDPAQFNPRELEEALEDPFSVRFLPDYDRSDGSSRYYLIGRTVADRYLFLSFSTDGKKARIIAARDMAPAERRFYDRRYSDTK